MIVNTLEYLKHIERNKTVLSDDKIIEISLDVDILRMNTENMIICSEHDHLANNY